MKQSIKRGRLKTPMAAEVAEIMVAPTLVPEEIARSYPHYIDVNKAHVLMLARQGIIERTVAAEILGVAREMAAMGTTPDFPIVPELEEMYFNLENHLIERIGMEKGGRQHTARSRNDLHAMVDRMLARSALLDLEALINRFRRTLLALAADNTDAVMSGHTHLQPSEPITFAHYLSAVLHAVERDFARLHETWTRINLNPLGGGSMGSTTWPIDRQMTAKLLGFDGVLENSLDCVCSRDYLIEILNDVAMLAGTLARMATDMRLWSAPEYGCVEVSDSCAVCSSIMPQKKNPWTFETCASLAARVKGAADAAWMTYKGVPYAFTMESMDLIACFWPAIRDVSGMLRLMIVTMEGLTFHKARARTAAESNFSTVTELANTLVREEDLSFRSAHEIVAHAVGRLVAEGRHAGHITAKMLSSISEELFGKPVRITDETVRQALDPVLNVERKTVIGGTAQSEVERQLSVLREQIDRDEEDVGLRRAKLEAASKLLNQEVDALIRSASLER